MNVRRVERITSLSVRALQNERACYGLFLSEAHELPLHVAHGASPAEALNRLVEWHYQLRRAEVFSEQNFRCWACWSLTGLSCDHIKPRGQGRSDVRTNLRGLCAKCHDRQTNNRKIEIHPKMEALMYKVGLRWLGEYAGDLQPYGWERIALDAA